MSGRVMNIHFNNLPRGWAMTSEPEPDLAFENEVKHAPENYEYLLRGLNDQQRAAVIHQGPPLLIVAGAGSGKTRVLTHRVAYLLASGRAHAGEILALTFTNKAAAEMRERCIELIGSRARNMWVSTFHSTCVRILREHAQALGYKKSFTIYDSADSQKLITLILKEKNLDPKRFHAKAVANIISNQKNELIDAAQYAHTVNEANNFDSAISQVYTSYQARLQQANAVDFDDIIMLTVGLLQRFPEVAGYYQRRFRHILVDEYQDTNHAQYVLIRELIGVSGSGAETGLPIGELTVVGDGDQSIYAFRGATIRNIEEFEQDFPSATTIYLEQNYRSTQNILSAANAVISNNQDRRPKRLWTALGDGEKITGYVADDEHAEARFIAQEIDRLIDSEDFKPADFAVFYRANAQSRAVEEVFIRVGIPYRVIGGTRFYERKEIKDVIAYLRVISNPDDDVNLLRIINVPKRGIGDRAESALNVFAQQQSLSLFAALARASEIPGLTARSLKPLQAFYKLLAELQEFAADATIGDLVTQVCDQSGYLPHLKASSDPQDMSRVENIAEFNAVANEFERDNLEATLEGFLEQISLVADADQLADETENYQGQVTLMTLHTAKGLEFPVVFLTGLEDGTFPHARCLHDPTELNEERRLAYVGLTRARQRLVLSAAHTRSSWGATNNHPLSRFLQEIPEELMDWKRSPNDARRNFASGYSGGYSTHSGGYANSYSNRADADFAPAYGSGFSPRRGGAKNTGSGPSSTASSSVLSSAQVADEDIISVTVGEKVRHTSFGEGVVVAISGRGRGVCAEVDFGQRGTKRLLLRIAPIQKI